MAHLESSSRSIGELRPMSGRRTTSAHIREILHYRDLLILLVRKDLAVRYKGSSIGFFWSMFQPIVLLLVYSVVFAILEAGFARFSTWVLSGLIVWTLIASSLTSATTSITSNAALVAKVKFPRAVLPLASVGGALAHFCLQSVAFVVVLALTRQNVDWPFVALLPVALTTTLVVCAALALLLAACNVYARDTMHLLDMLVLGWFWATPILYPYEQAASWLQTHRVVDEILLLNPATPIAMTFQRAVYGSTTAETMAVLPDHGPSWYLSVLVLTAAIWTAVGYLSLRTFDKADVNMAENL